MSLEETTLYLHNCPVKSFSSLASCASISSALVANLQYSDFRALFSSSKHAEKEINHLIP